MSYYSGQTLVHKTKRFLARLVSQDSSFHWPRGKSGTLFVDEKGKKFIANLSDFTNLSDEWGQPYANQPEIGQFVDESAKAYIDPANVRRLRRNAIKRLKRAYLQIEKDILDCMTTKQTKPQSKEYNYELPSVTWTNRGVDFFVGHKYSANDYLDFTQWFLSRRNGKALYQIKNSDGQYYSVAISFSYAGSEWVWDRLYEREFLEQPKN